MSFRHHAHHPQTSWVLVADRAHARIFSTSDPELRDLSEVKTLIHSESAVHARDVLTDRPGRFAGLHGEYVSGEPETDFRHQTAQDFAVQIVAELEHGRTQNRYGQLIIIAPSLLLGVLRKHLPEALKKLIIAEVDKELVRRPVSELAESVRQAMLKHAAASPRE